MADPKTYTGSCHCNAVRFRVTAAIETILSCNCSMCRRRGSLLAFVPAAAFTLEAGADNLTEYLFNKHVIHHTFCKTCGILSFASGDAGPGPMVAINVRCLDDVDLQSFSVQDVDGKAF